MSPEEREARCGSDADTHVLMPNMAFGCGGTVLSKKGDYTFGTGEWERVTCPTCRSLGRVELWARARRMYEHEPTTCPCGQCRGWRVFAGLEAADLLDLLN